MTAPERFADSQIPLAPRAPSIHDPSRINTKSVVSLKLQNLRLNAFYRLPHVGAQAELADRKVAKTLQMFLN